MTATNGPQNSELFGPRLKARVLSYLFVAGAGVGTLTLIFPHDDAIEDTPLYGLAVLASALALWVWSRADSISERGLHVVIAIGTVILSVANYLVGTTVLYPVIYSWTALYSFTCFALRPALMQMGLIAVSYAVVLVAQDAPSPATRWLLAVGTPLVTGVLISRLLERLRVEADQVAQRNRGLAESEARTRAIVDAAPDAFATIDAEGTVLQWNHEAERLFGIPSREAIGHDVAQLMFAPEHRPTHVERRRMDLEGPPRSVPARREVEMIRRNGESFPAEVIVSRVTGEGRPLLAFFVHDLSDRERRDREREQLLREQAARQEAEQMAGVVRGLQVLLDTALSHTRLEPMLADLVPRVCQVVAAEAATFLLVDETGVLVVRASTAPVGEHPVRIKPGEGISGKVAESGEPMLLADAPPEMAADPALRGMRSVVSVPLMAAGTVTGVIQVGVPEPDRFTEDDLLLLRLAADRVGLAIDHVRVYEREHRIAETLQRSLLPDRLPSLPGLEVAARYLAAASESEVGGDWYDVIAIDSSRVGLVMGDVAGKGLAAASMVGRLRSAMRAYVLEGHDARTVVDRLNQLVWSELEDSQMATLVYMVVDQGEETISWVNAGHLPPLVIEEDGSARLLEGPSSVPLGVMPYAQYESGSMELAPGSTMVLYTDGLVERPGEVLDDGLERLVQAAGDPGGGTERLCDELLARLVPGGAASDDVAILALHCPAIADRFSLTLPAVPGELASMRALLRRWLRQTAGTDEDVAEILIAAGEAAANAIEHGGNEQPFEIAGVVDGGDVDITVTNRGIWRDNSPERGGGRGLVLIRELMDEVEVIRAEQGTTVHMRRRLHDGHGS